jgi:hypothetical protein
MLNALLMMRLASSPAFYESEHMLFDGQPVVDPSRRYYYGNSQGTSVFGCLLLPTNAQTPPGLQVASSGLST